MTVWAKKDIRARYSGSDTSFLCLRPDSGSGLRSGTSLPAGVDPVVDMALRPGRTHVCAVGTQPGGWVSDDVLVVPALFAQTLLADDLAAEALGDATADSGALPSARHARADVTETRGDWFGVGFWLAWGLFLDGGDSGEGKGLRRVVAD